MDTKAYDTENVPGRNGVMAQDDSGQGVAEADDQPATSADNTTDEGGDRIDARGGHEGHEN